jgi:hypothetical protein
MLSAVQIFNNPNIHFKSEISSFWYNLDVLTTLIIRNKKIEYRYFRQTGHKGKKFDKTKKGALNIGNRTLSWW